MSNKSDTLLAIQREQSADRLLLFAEGFKLWASNPYCYAPRFFKLLAHLALNRVCELACTPLHQRYVETSNGAELAWFTYRPVAIPNEPNSWPDAVQLVGYVDDLTETEARSRAIGW